MNLTDSPVSLAPAPLAPGTRLPIARYRLSFRMHDTLRLPNFAGSMLRGRFGAALRRTACLTRAPTCSGCSIVSSCAYSTIFDAPAPASHELQTFDRVPNPYVIEPPAIGTREIAAGTLLSFGLVLIGRALEQLPLIVYVMQRALAHTPGKDAARGELEQVTWELHDRSVTVWEATNPRIRPHRADLEVPAFGNCTLARLDIRTPLRLQDNGRPLRAGELSPRKLTTALIRRAALLFEFHAQRPGLGAQASALARHAATLADERALTWHDWSRYSARQGQRMTLGGVLGTWVLRGELAPLVPWLWLGQWLHVGKNATMGMGHYTLSLGHDGS